MTEGFDGAHFRSVMGNYPTGVAAVTAMSDDGLPLGMVVGTFNAVSLDPPLVCFLASKDSSSFRAMRTASSFCVNVLSESQEQVCRSFAVKNAANKFHGVRWLPSEHSGSPAISGSAAWIDCDVHSVTEAGDHFIVIGRARWLAAGSGAPALPLLFYQGGYGRFSSHSRVMPATRGTLEHIQLVDAVREYMESIARELGMECAAAGVIDNSVVCLASAGAPPDGLSPIRVGVQLPFEAPMAPLFVAWAAPALRERWLGASGLVSDEERGRHRAALDRLRTRGWTISRYNSGLRAVDERISALPRAQAPMAADERLRSLAATLNGPDVYECDVDPLGSYQIRNVSAPIFDQRGNVALYLTLFGFPVSISGARALDIITRLTQTASRATTALSRTVFNTAELAAGY